MEGVKRYVQGLECMEGSRGAGLERRGSRGAGVGEEGVKRCRDYKSGGQEVQGLERRGVKRCGSCRT